MKLVPREAEKLALHSAGFLAQKRLARGLRLNYTEAIALIASQILEFVRDGDKTVTDLMDLGKQMLGRFVCAFSAVTNLLTPSPETPHLSIMLISGKKKKKECTHFELPRQIKEKHDVDVGFSVS